MNGDPILTDDERSTVANWIVGIENGTWNPTPATKRVLADVLRRVLMSESR